jgi:predicted RNA-binding protein with PUA-like domain
LRSLYIFDLNAKDMAHWLVKSEPSSYSWDKFQKDGSATWDGVRNYAARNNLRSMKKNDEVMFYHSNEGMEIVGIGKVSKEAFQDPTTDEEAWLAVELKPVKRLKNPVSLSTIKKHPVLKNMALVRLGRLSVQPVTEEEWKLVLELSSKS